MYITTVITIVSVLLTFGIAEAQFLKISTISVNYVIDAQDGYHNVVLVCDDAVLVYDLEMFIIHNDTTDRYAVYADSIRLGDTTLQHTAYDSEDSRDSLNLLEGFADGQPHPLLIPRYTPLIIPVLVSGDHTDVPTTALLDVTHAGNEGVTCHAGALHGPQRIGLITQTTKAGAQISSHILPAAQMAADDFNRHLESVGAQWSIELVVKDDQGSPETSLKSMQELAKSGITSVVGPDSNESLAAIGKYAERQQMVVISGASSTVSLSVPDHIFRTIPDDDIMIKALANILHNDSVDVAITIHTADSYGKSLNDGLERELQALGGRIASSISYTAGEDTSSDYDTIASQLGDIVGILDDTKGVAVILISLTDMEKIAQAAMSIDALRDIKWYGSDPMTHLPDITRGDLGDFIRDVNFTIMAGLVPPTPLNQDLTQRLAVELNLRADQSPDLFSYSTYDAVFVLAKTIAATQSIQSEDIIDAISHVAARTYGAMSDDTLNVNGDLAVAYYGVWRPVDGSWTQTGTYDSITGTISTLDMQAGT